MGGRKGRWVHRKWIGGLLILLFSGLLHAGTHHHYYTDPQGNVLAKTDAQGNFIATYDYAPYGAAVTSMSPAPNGPGYTGHVNDPDTGLVYMQARYYDPAMGRFLSVDPVGPAAGNAFNFNRYGYVNNNPVNHIDPTGKTCEESGSSSSYVCKVDQNSGNFSKDDIATINQKYTLTVNTLVANSNRTAAITVGGKTTTANAGDVAKQLIAAKVITASGGGINGNTRASTLGGGLTSAFGENGHAVTKIYEHAMHVDRYGENNNQEAQQELPLTFVHEGIHMLPTDSAMSPIYNADPKQFGSDHQKPYDAAGSELYDPEIW